MQPNYRKTILTTILYTLLGLIVALAVFVCLMIFVFTEHFAAFAYDMGFDNIAANLYYKAYEKDEEIINCYKALNIEISLGDSENVIKYYADFVGDNEYNEFIQALAQKNESLSIGVLEKSILLNEEEYLADNYIKALIEDGQNDKAFSFALETFNSNESVELKGQGAYIFSQLISEANVNLFNKVYDGMTNTLIEEVQGYFDKLVITFGENKLASENVDRAYLMALGNKIINVGQDINQMYAYMSISSDKTESNHAQMNQVNDIMKGLI